MEQLKCNGWAVDIYSLSHKWLEGSCRGWTFNNVNSKSGLMFLLKELMKSNLTDFKTMSELKLEQ